MFLSVINRLTDAGSPHEYFDTSDARAHTECAGRIIDFFHELTSHEPPSAL